MMLEKASMLNTNLLQLRSDFTGLTLTILLPLAAYCACYTCIMLAVYELG